MRQLSKNYPLTDPTVGATNASPAPTTGHLLRVCQVGAEHFVIYRR